MSTNKHHLRRLSRKYVHASEKARKQQESIIFESKQKVQKVELDDEDSDLVISYSDKSNGKPVIVDIDEYVLGSSGKEPTLALLPIKSKAKESKNNGETWVGRNSREGDTSVRRSNRKFKPLEWLGSIPYLWA